MLEYRDLPPSKNFERVLKVCPKSALIYAQLWHRRDEHRKVRLGKKEIRQAFLMSPTLFMNLLLPLISLSLLSVVEDGDELHIALSGAHWNE